MLPPEALRPASLRASSLAVAAAAAAAAARAGTVSSVSVAPGRCSHALLGAWVRSETFQLRALSKTSIDVKKMSKINGST